MKPEAKYVFINVDYHRGGVGVSEVNEEILPIEQRRNERAGGTGYPRENPPVNDIVRHDSHMRKSGVTRLGIEPESPWWETSRLTAQPPWRQKTVGNFCARSVRAVNNSRSCPLGSLDVSDERANHPANFAVAASRKSHEQFVRECKQLPATYHFSYVAACLATDGQYARVSGINVPGSLDVSDERANHPANFAVAASRKSHEQFVRECKQLPATVSGINVPGSLDVFSYERANHPANFAVAASRKSHEQFVRECKQLPATYHFSYVAACLATDANFAVAASRKSHEQFVRECKQLPATYHFSYVAACLATDGQYARVSGINVPGSLDVFSYERANHPANFAVASSRKSHEQFVRECKQLPATYHFSYVAACLATDGQYARVSGINVPGSLDVSDERANHPANFAVASSRKSHEQFVRECKQLPATYHFSYVAACLATDGQYARVSGINVPGSLDVFSYERANHPANFAVASSRKSHEQFVRECKQLPATYHFSYVAACLATDGQYARVSGINVPSAFSRAAEHTRTNRIATRIALHEKNRTCSICSFRARCALHTNLRKKFSCKVSISRKVGTHLASCDRSLTVFHRHPRQASMQFLIAKFANSMPPITPFHGEKLMTASFTPYSEAAREVDAGVSQVGQRWRRPPRAATLRRERVSLTHSSPRDHPPPPTCSDKDTLIGVRDPLTSWCCPKAPVSEVKAFRKHNFCPKLRPKLTEKEEDSPNTFPRSYGIPYLNCVNVTSLDAEFRTRLRPQERRRSVARPGRRTRALVWRSRPHRWLAQGRAAPPVYLQARGLESRRGRSEVRMEQRRYEKLGNGRPLRKPAEQRHTLERFPLMRKYGSNPAENRTRFA
ncbi:hypothetical protein PR048_016980 [Dryococelus australis]|uniref:Uncharacterized protein n=1 Tax=Dryococelus australis TaxID=614101 RepID=A0ABQ9H8G4_9NEOP|nr:hypothetical protein PR048_016980 [Dryococelus australis]